MNAVARARNTDPSSSHDAAALVESSGKADSHRAVILGVLNRHPSGLTAGEIAAFIGDDEIDAVACRKRLPELKKLGLAHADRPRKCSIELTKQQVWFPVRNDAPATQKELFA